MKIKPIVGVLLMHGFLGSPREFGPLEASLQAQGYRTRSVTQLGHGPHPRVPLSAVTVESLVAHCAQEYHVLAGECDAVFLVGHSMGGLCALVLAGRNLPKLAGVAAFSTPYEHATAVNYPQCVFQFGAERVMPALRYAPQFWTGFERPVFLPWFYPHLYREMRSMMTWLHRSLPLVSVPVCLAHSLYDMAVPHAEMAKIAQAIGQPERVNTYTLEACGHQIFPHSDSQEAAGRLVHDFILEQYPDVLATGRKWVAVS